MTCDDALMLLLDSDLTALHDVPVTPLGQHLVGCARCRRVASQLVADSAFLAGAVRKPHTDIATRRPRAMPWLVGGTLAAAGVAGVMLWGGDETTELPTAPATVPVVEAAATPPAPERPTTVAVAPASTPRVTAPRPVPQPSRSPKPTPAPASVSPTLVPASRSPTLASVTVDPVPAAEPVRVLPVERVAPVVATPYRAVALGSAPTPIDERATEADVAPAPSGTILRTSNPNIIVVWHQTP